MPILFSLTYYMHDLVLLRKYYQDVSFTAHQMVNLIQNITLERSNQKITLQDLKYAHTAAWYTVYPGTTMFGQNSGHTLGHMPRSIIFCVKGLANGKASCVWRAYCATNTSSENPSGVSSGGMYSQNDAAEWLTQYKTNVEPTKIHPDLKIKEGEIKIILDIAMTRKTGRLPDGRTVSLREAFKLFIVNPKFKGDASNQNVIESSVIFTPKSGLFSETVPS